jgi:hypothetical protein
VVRTTNQDLWSTGALDQLDQHLLDPKMSDDARKFGGTRRVYQANTFTPTDVNSPAVKTIVLRPHSQSDICVEFGFQQTIGAGHYFNVYARIGHVDMDSDTGAPPSLESETDRYRIDWGTPENPDLLFDNFPDGSFHIPSENPGFTDLHHDAGAHATASPQVTLSYDHPATTTRAECYEIAKAFYRSLRPNYGGQSTGFKNKLALDDISPQLALYFAKADHVYPVVQTRSNQMAFLREYLEDSDVRVFSAITLEDEAGFEDGSIFYDENAGIDRLPLSPDTFNALIHLVDLGGGITQADKALAERLLSDARKSATILDSGKEAVREFLGIKLFGAIGVIKEIFKGREKVGSLASWLGRGKATGAIGKAIPAGPEYDYLRSIFSPAVKQYARIMGMQYGTPQEIEAANLAFLDDLLFHKADGKTPLDANWHYYNIPVLSDAMILLLYEGVRTAIKRAVATQVVLGMEITPATKRYYLEALDILKGLPAALQALRTPGNLMSLGQAYPDTFPADIAGQQGYILDANGILAEKVLAAIQLPLEALFKKLPGDLSHFFDAKGLFNSDTRNMLVTHFAEDAIGNVMLNALPMGDRMLYRKTLIVKRLMEAVANTGFERGMGMLLRANGLKQVGTTWTSPDGYVYFEVIEARPGGSTEKLLCRVYQGAAGVLWEGIEIFLNARVDGVAPDQVPDPDSPATTTGHLDGVDGLRATYNAAPLDQKRAAYQDWLASPAHAHFRTRHLDEFYTHFVYPPT